MKNKISAYILATIHLCVFCRITAHQNRNIYLIERNLPKVVGLCCPDITKTAIKWCIKKKLDLNLPFSDYLVDYGSEAAFAIVIEGPQRIPHWLVKYACIDCLYRYSLQAGQCFGCDYPSYIKDNWYLNWAIWIMRPYFLKLALRIGVDLIVDYVCADGSDEDAFYADDQDLG